MGSDSKPVVEISHGYSIGVLGGSRNVEQATKAIRGSTLRRIKVDYLGEETGGFQGDGCNAHGQPPDAETNPDSIRTCDVLVCCWEDIVGILKYMMIWMPSWSTSKDLLRRTGWSMVEVAMMNPSQVEFPVGQSVQMNILTWNCRGALNLDFTTRVFEMVVNHHPSIVKEAWLENSPL